MVLVVGRDCFVTVVSAPRNDVLMTFKNSCLSGMPVRIVLFLGKYFFDSSQEIQIVVANGAMILLARPAFLVCSWVIIGIPSMKAAKATGTWTYPPKQTMQSGRNFMSSFN